MGNQREILAGAVLDLHQQAVNQRPASALPWSAEQDTVSAVDEGQRYDVAEFVAKPHVPQSVITRNAAYAAHAANAYPKLIAALQPFTNSLWAERTLEELPNGMGRRIREAQALLRELGEKP